MEEKKLRDEWKEEFHHTPDYARRGEGKPKATTTKQARDEGLIMRKMKHLADTQPNGSGAKSRYEEEAAHKSFKDNSVFTEILGTEWDLLMRVAVDPAHELHNLVKDILSLICNKGSMSLTVTHLEWEQKFHRFKDFAGGPSSAPWVASTKRLGEVENVVAGEGHNNSVLRSPYGWPTNVHYFGEDLKKGKGRYIFNLIRLNNLHYLHATTY